MHAGHHIKRWADTPSPHVTQRFKSTIFLTMMTPIDTKPSQGPTQAQHGSACKILLPYVLTFLEFIV